MSFKDVGLSVESSFSLYEFDEPPHRLGASALTLVETVYDELEGQEPSGGHDLLEQAVEVRPRHLQIVGDVVAVEAVKAAPANKAPASKPKTGRKRQARAGRDSDDPDIIRFYLADIGQYALLTKEEEGKLSARVHAGQVAAERLACLPDEARTPRALRATVADGEEAKDIFVKANLRLVVSIAKRYNHDLPPEIDLMDLIQVGNLSLPHAVEKFDGRKGFKFSTYATWWIRQALQRALYTAGAISLPISRAEDVQQLTRLEEQAKADGSEGLKDEELCYLLGITQEELEGLRRDRDTARGTLQLDAELAKDSDTTLGEMLGVEEPGYEAQEGAALADQMVAGIKRLFVGTLPGTYEAFMMSFGFSEGGAMTNTEIGQVLGFDREKTRRLLAEAMSRLQHPAAWPITSRFTEFEGEAWQDLAACQPSQVPEYFNKVAKMSEQVVHTCASCEVQGDCLNFALINCPTHGIWAGLSNRELKRTRKAAGRSSV